MCFKVVDTAVQVKSNLDCWKVMRLQNDGKVNSCLHPCLAGYFLKETIFGTGATSGHPRRHAMSLSKLVELSSQVVHSFDNCDSARKVAFWYSFYFNTPICIVKCTIPKGTWCWHNPKEHEYASFKVRLDTIIEKFQ